MATNRNLQPYDAQGDLIGELGELDQMSVLMQQLQSNPQLAQLYQQAMGGMNQGSQQELRQVVAR